MEKIYIAIDLKSFYASVECRERGLDPLVTNLVVADESRTDKTICLAVSPSLKSFGIPGRPRLFEVRQAVDRINRIRAHRTPDGRLTKKARDLDGLEDESAALDLYIAPPRMALYMKYSTRIYNIYLRHIAPEDIFAYSIDEVFIDATAYLHIYNISAHELAMRMVRDVLNETGITATAGIGTNLFLAKVAMDIVAKHAEPDSDGVRIAELDEASYRSRLWGHRPLTDFWRVGRGSVKRLASHGLFTMGDIARFSESEAGEKMLYKLFGVNAELLIDHAWGWEPTTLADVRSYEPEKHSVGSGQVLQRPYKYDECRIIVREMTELLVLDLVEKGLVADGVVITIGYDIDNLLDETRRQNYRGPVTTDFYGRQVPKHAHGTEGFGGFSSSTRTIVDAAMSLFERIINPSLLVRRVTVSMNNCVSESEATLKREIAQGFEQMDLFTMNRTEDTDVSDKARKREEKMQRAIIKLKHKYGSNAVLKGMNLENGAMTIERNSQIGGHKA